MLNCDLSDPEMCREPREGHGFVYMYTFENGKRYIGQTVSSVKSRTRNHSYKHDTLVDRVIGSGARFSIDILSEVPLEALDDAEIYCIRHFRTVKPDGYNLLVGGFEPKNLAPPVRERAEASVRRYWKNVGIEERRRRLRPMLDSRKMEVICLETGEVYESLNEAGRSTGVSIPHISDMLKGKRHTAGGMHWMICSEGVVENRREILDCFIEWDRTCNALNKRKVAYNLPWNRSIREEEAMI